jgi:hypothetical protein
VLHRVDRIGANMEIGGNCIRDCGHRLLRYAIVLARRAK